MKFCSRPYEHLYINKDGNTRCCSWATYSLGNIVDEGMMGVWNGAKAKEIRASIADGSFRYCDKPSCPLLNNNSLPDIDRDQFDKLTNDYIGKSPTEFNLAYDFICNHSCPSCRNNVFTPDAEYKEKLLKIESEILPHLNNANLIMASGNGDFFSSKYMMNLFSKIRPNNPGCVIKIETNGALVKKNWRKIKSLEKYDLRVVVTPNSFENEAYTILSGGHANLELTLKGLELLSELRKKGKVKEFKITMVVQDVNFREIPNFIKKCINEFNVDLVQLRPLMRWFKISGKDFLEKNVANPMHPDHEEYISIMKNPICRGPKVYHWNGDIFIK